jgi:chitinase
MGLLQIVSGIFVLLAITLPSSFAAEARGKIVCYYGSWAQVDSLIPGDKCTHVIYSFIGLDDQTWRYKFLDGYDDWTRTRLREFLSLKSKFPGTKFLIAVGGGAEGSDKYSRMAEVSSRRQTFVQSIVEFLREYQFDGVDMDWEYPGADWTGGRAVDKQTFPLLIQDLRNALNSIGRQLELTMAVSISEYIVGLGYDVPKFCNNVDAVHLMVYDLRGPWDEYADVHSAIHGRANDREDYRNYNLDYGGPLWNRAGCPLHKLVVGVPFYGHEFVVQGTNQPGARIDQDASYNLPDSGYTTYATLCKRLTDSTWVKTFDNEVGCPYMTKGRNFLGYDDVQSLRLKTDWIKSHGFGGAMVWAIEEDDHAGNCGQRAPLITTLYDNLKNYTVTIP